MLYQETFQSGENPSEINVSSCIYLNGVNQEGGENVEYGFPNHCHSFYEVNFSFEGEGEFTLNSRRCGTKANSLYLVPPLAVHGSVGYGQSVNMVLQFSYNFLSRNASTFPQNAMLVLAGELQEKGSITLKNDSLLMHYIDQIAEITPRFVTPMASEDQHVDYSVQYEWKLNGLTLRLIDLLIETGNVKIVSSASNYTEVIKIQSVLDRLITHPEERLSMESAAKMACMSYSSFCRTFSRIIGKSYVDYCNEARIHRAEEYLKARRLSVTEIAQLLNFGSVSYFNRIFKRYNGYTPMEYRAK